MKNGQSQYQASNALERSIDALTDYRALALAIIDRALIDATSDMHPETYNKGQEGYYKQIKEDAIRFLTATSGKAYIWRVRWCLMADIAPEWLDRVVKERLAACT